jgi:hypothetical protein
MTQRLQDVPAFQSLVEEGEGCVYLPTMQKCRDMTRDELLAFIGMESKMRNARQKELERRRNFLSTL